jgi:hypothetical protein
LTGVRAQLDDVSMLLLASPARALCDVKLMARCAHVHPAAAVEVLPHRGTALLRAVALQASVAHEALVVPSTLVILFDHKMVGVVNVLCLHLAQPRDVVSCLVLEDQQPQVRNKLIHLRLKEACKRRALFALLCGKHRADCP